MGPVFHFDPHISTNFFLTSAVGCFAKPLSGHGRAGEKKLDPPQLPRIEHLPASCVGVKRSLDAKPVKNSPAASTNECRILPEEACLVSALVLKNEPE